jgi:mannosylglycoprotein endo-beta-mannosidase
VPASFKGKTVWLKFDGTHWRATYYLNGQRLGTVTGAYQRGIFNVTDLLKHGSNALAVKIDPLSNPGKPKNSGCGGDRQIGNTPAAIYANVGWDFSFVDGVRDRSIGIIRDVSLYATGPVDIRDPFMSTAGVPTTESANLNFRTLLVNGSHQEQSGKLVVEFGDQKLSRDITLAPDETRDLKLSHAELTALVYNNPKLWWPNGRGAPHLYPLTVSFKVGSGAKSRVQRLFGIRSIENRPEKKQWVCWVNGKRMFMSGGNWVQDAMQRQTPEREEAQVRMIRDAGLNWLRLWSPSGPLGDEFFDACDKLGVMVWAEANLCEQVVCPRGDADYVKITLDNWADYILRIRNHACLFNYAGCNEGNWIKPRPDIAGMEGVVEKHDGTRPYSPSSQDLGQRGAPYRWIGIKGYYDYSNKDLFGAGPMGLFGGFCNESGAPGLPVAETLRELIPADKIFPADREYVEYLDGGGFHQMFQFIDALKRFGDAGTPDMAGRTGVDNYGFKGQLLNAQVYRAMSEQWQRNKWDEAGRFATGYALWTIKNTHPQICSRIYDYSLEANSSLYYLGHANKPLHVQFNYKENDVTAVNNSFEPAAKLKVKAEVRKLDWTLAWSGEAALESLPAEATKIGLVKVPSASGLKLAEVHFIRCQLLNQKNEVLDDTFYWRTSDDASFGVEGDFTGLNQMSGSSLSVRTKTGRKNGKALIRVRLENKTGQLAFFTRIKVLDSAKKLLRPCFYSDNYFSVPPGDTKTVEIECPPSLAGEPTVVVEGWNVGILSLGANARGQTPAVRVPEFSAPKTPIPKRREIVSLSEINTAPVSSSDEPIVLPDWAIGPFVRPPNAQPVIRPNPDSVFDCPMRNQPVNWAARHTFNPAAVVKDGKIYVLYRAEDNSGTGGIGSFTSRLGLAISEDGIHFTREAKPVLFPDNDSQKDVEWTGGCEDPRLAEGPDGTYVVTYTQYVGHSMRYRLGLATSKDLRTWTKHGCPFTGTAQAGMKTKSAAIVQELRDGRLVAARIKGRFWMYFGVGNIDLASSDDLIHWKVEKGGVLHADNRSFDSSMVESGCSPILTKDGIVMIYNGVTKSQAYVCGQALFSAEDPAKLVARLPKPFFSPAVDWEKTGQYKAGTTFAEGLVFFKHQWFMYYGCADTFVGVAIAPAPTPGAKP